jgi:ribose/xylose/arabinose/galactoside ABC-type transport system permease subunit
MPNEARAHLLAGPGGRISRIGRRLPLPGEREGGLLITLGVLSALIAFGSHGAFWTPVNMDNLLVSAAITAIPAIGMTVVILTGGIDVSIGSMLGLVAAIGGLAFEANWSLPAVVPIFCLAGAGLGLLNAMLIIPGRVPPVIATLGTLSIFRMLVFLVLGSNWITAIPPSLTTVFIVARIGPLPMASIIALVMLILAAFVLGQFRLGRHVYAIGNNEEAARLSGIRVRRIKLYAYTLLGLLTGVAALMTLGQSPMVQTSTGEGFELKVIAAVVLGGTELSGGRGSILGTLLGTLIVELVDDGVVLLHIQPFWSGVLLGAIILFSVGAAWRPARSA